MKRHLSAFLTALLTAGALMARPAQPGTLRTLTLADGTRIEARLVGDEFGHCFLTPDGRYLRPVSQQDTLYRFIDKAEFEAQQQLAEARRSSARTAAPLTSFPTIGTVRGLVILTEFQDIQFQPELDNAQFQRQMNEAGYSDYASTGSARDFFIDQSNGLFVPEFDVIGPVRLPYEESYYGRNNSYDQDSNPGMMVKHACEIAHDSLGIDFSQYDFDDNGEVDFVFCIYAGYGESYGALSTTIWPHMSYLNSQYVYLDLDGKSVNRYACSCELRGNNGHSIDGIGAFCHEFSHVLGLPDLYNTHYASDLQLGYWDTMDQGNYNNNSRTPPYYSAFERWSLGWLELTDITQPADTMALGELTSTWQAYRIPTTDPDEYFILENRQKQGWDSYQPGRGLMITHIQYIESCWSGNSVNSGMHPLVDLVEADGSQGAPYETDLYPIAGNDMFTDYSEPNSLMWDGTPTERGVSRICQEADGRITFAYMRDRLKRPVLLEATEVTDSSFVASWNSIDEATSYRLHLHELLPDSINDLYLELDGTTMPDDWASYSELALDDDALRLGRYGVSGSMVSQVVNLLPGSTALTLCFDARSYPGKSVSYDVTLLDAEGNIFSQQSLKATRNTERQLIYYDDCPASVVLKLETRNERLYIEDLRLVDGHRDTADVWTAGPADWCLDALTDTQCLVTGLAADRSYTYDVTAIDDVNPLRSSLASASQTVTTLPAHETAIQLISSPRTRSSRTYDLQGRPTQRQQGLVIVNGMISFVNP